MIRRIGLATLAALSTLVLTPGDAQAAGANIGGGAISGSITITSANGIPPAGEPCLPTTFDVEGTAPGFVLNTVITGYVGTVIFEGTGSTNCSAGTAAGGTMDIIGTGEGPTGSTLNCHVTGSFTRVGIVADAILNGSCVVNNYGTGPVAFVTALAVAPLSTEPGEVAAVTDEVRFALFNGVFAIIPV